MKETVLVIGGYALDKKRNELENREKEVIESVTSPGGSGWLLCLACKGIGVRSALATSFGTDPDGYILREWANDEDIRLINVPSESYTGTTCFETVIHDGGVIEIFSTTKALSLSERTATTLFEELDPSVTIVGYVDERTVLGLAKCSRKRKRREQFLVAGCSDAFTGFSPKALVEVLDLYDLVVMNEFEWRIVRQKVAEDERALLKKLYNKAEVVVTGSDNIRCYKNGICAVYEFDHFSCRDSIGAGDAITASLSLGRGLSDAESVSKALGVAKWMCSLVFKGRVGFGEQSKDGAWPVRKVEQADGL